MIIHSSEKLYWPPLGRRLAIASRLYAGALSGLFEDIELERHYSVLIAVHNFTEACNQQFLANTLHIDKASMVRIIDALVTAGYIAREVSSKDRRAHNILLTEKGMMVLPMLQKAVHEVNNVAFNGFSDSEKSTFLSTLQKLSKNLSELNDTDNLDTCDQSNS
jgi:DNA-binding MarR family transcriptional regulator